MTSIQNDDGIDQLLRSYFRREMPARFPDAPAVAVQSASPAWTMSAGRAIVGFSLVALLALYIGLSAFFPRELASGLNSNGQPQIGSRPGVIAPKSPAPLQQQP